jgi:hypothetical protein
MNIEERDTLIENYVLGQLPPAELQNFEAEMAKDSTLQAEVSDQKFILEGLRDSAGAFDFRNLLTEINAENASEMPQIGQKTQNEGKIVSLGRRNLFSAFAIAASLALAFFGWKHFFAEPPLSSEQLFAANFSTPESLSLDNVRGENRGKNVPDPDSLARIFFNDANQFFKEKNNLAAISKLGNALAATNAPAIQNEILKEKGQLQLMEKQFAEAEKTFAAMTEKGENRDWFTALAVLGQSNRRTDARQLFETFSKNQKYDGPRHQKALDILKNLK